MSDNPKDLELFHYGVKGMRWGKRKAPVKAHYDDLDDKTLKKVNRKLTGFNNSVAINNRVADKINPELDKLNAKYSKKPLMDAMESEYTAYGKKYLAEYDGLNQKFTREAMGEHLRAKSKGRYDIDFTARK